MLTKKKKEAAIRKWIGISHGRIRDYQGSNCTLCKEYENEVYNLGDCDNSDGETCPIALNGYKSCDGSPYGTWRKHQNEQHKTKQGKIEWNKKATCPECKVLALTEMFFVYNAIDKHLGWS